MFVWLVIWPLRPKEWSYKKVLTFVSLTSAPAILYAIPVERFLSLPTARSVNAWFLSSSRGLARCLADTLPEEICAASGPRDYCRRVSSANIDSHDADCFEPGKSSL